MNTSQGCFIILCVCMTSISCFFYLHYSWASYTELWPGAMIVKTHRFRDQRSNMHMSYLSYKVEILPSRRFVETIAPTSFAIDQSYLMPEINETVSRESEEEKDWLRKMNTIQKKRKSVLRKMCSERYNQSVLPLDQLIVDKKNLYSLLVIDKLRAVFSFVHKCASSSWSRLFRSLPGVKAKRIYRMPAKEIKWRLQNYTKFIFVRHPLSRLLSAYRDKFIYHHIPHYISVGRQILRSTRKNATSEELKRALDVKFIEFLTYIAQGEKHRGNTHWNTYIRRNKVCLMDFDFIGKFETMFEDADLILRHLNVHDTSALGSRPFSTHANKSTAVEYYNSIPEPLLQNIINAYESDFLLFDYKKEVI